MRKIIASITFIMIIIVLSGCLYPQSELAKNQIPNEQQVEMVQVAVEQYMEATNGLIPIRTKSSDTAIYEQYLIDFTLLKERQLIADTPGTAYENGGIYQYIIITPEEDPRVRLIDLRTTEKLREVNRKIVTYRQSNLYPPFGEQASEGLYYLNYEKLGYDVEPMVVSPFTNTNLPILMNPDGELFIDYRIDLQQALQEFDHQLEEGDDIRSVLEDNYFFVPAYSVPYTIENNEPVFLNK